MQHIQPSNLIIVSLDHHYHHYCCNYHNYAVIIMLFKTVLIGTLLNKYMNSKSYWVFGLCPASGILKT
jgi:hypothetical protein